MPRLASFARIRVALTMTVLVVVAIVTVVARSWSSHAQAADGWVADAIVGDWAGQRQQPVYNYPSPPDFVLDPNVFMSFTPDGQVTLRIQNQIGTQERHGAYRVSGRTIVIPGFTSSTQSGTSLMLDVSFEGDTLRFVMQPSPNAFTQDDYAAVYELNRQ